MSLLSRTVATIVLAALLSACAPSQPPSNVVELASQLAGDHVLYDPARLSEITGLADFRPNASTRIPGVVLETPPDLSGRNGTSVNRITFDLTGTCTRVADFEQKFGEATAFFVAPDFGGLSFAWDFTRRGGIVRIVLSQMQRRTDCAKELSVAQPFPV